jgi:hypothetical protein
VIAMNLYRSALLGLLAAASAPAGELSFAPREGARVKKTFVQEITTKLKEMRQSIDGEPLEAAEVEQPTLELESRETITVVDQYVRVGAGRPLELVRNYEEVGSKSSRDVRLGDEGEQAQEEQGSPLEGRSVRFTWNESGERYEREFVGGEGDDALLEDLDEDMDLRDWLPGEEARGAESWEVPLKAFRYHLFAGGLDLEPVDGEAESDGELAEPSTQDYLDHATGAIRATRVEGGEGADPDLERLQVEIELETWVEFERQEQSATTRIEIAYDLEGELVWNRAEGRIERFEVEGEYDETIVNSVELEGESGSIDLVETLIFTGRARYAVETEVP